MIKYIRNKIKAFAIYIVSKRLKKCNHGFEIKDVCNTKTDPMCKNGCGKRLSELANVC
mgnify:CR=1 FL=1|jgi:hypothetical protein